MLDSRLDEFDEQQRFVFALLGLLSTSERIAELLKIRAQGAEPAPDSNVLDVALGLLSVRRALSFALAPPSIARETGSQVSTASIDEPGSASWLR